MATGAIELVKERINDAVVQSLFPEEPFHSINTLEWLLKLHPGADDAMKLAALGHDIERAFEEKRVRSIDFETYDEYKQAHALNSAQILTEIMESCGVEQPLVDEVAHLVAHHESGGSERQDTLRNANFLSFFHVCLPLYYDRKGAANTRKRCVWAYKKLPADIQQMIAEFEYMDSNLKRLVRDSLGLD